MGPLKKFLCCDLAVGVKVIGWFGLCCSILQIFSAITLDTSAFKRYQLERNHQTVSDIDIDSYRSSYITGGLIEGFVNCALLWAIKKQRKSLLLPWLVSRVFSIIVITLLTLGVGILLMINNLVGYGIASLLIGGIISAIYIYCWMCTVSLYNHYSDLEKVPYRNITTNIYLLENGNENVNQNENQNENKNENDLNQGNPPPYKESN